MNNGDRSPNTLASGVVSICQIFNIFSFVCLRDQIIGGEVLFSLPVVWITIAVVMVLNYFRYEYQNRYEKIKLRWEKLLPQKQVLMRLAIALYIIGSITVFFGVVALR